MSIPLAQPSDKPATRSATFAALFLFLLLGLDLIFSTFPYEWVIFLLPTLRPAILFIAGIILPSIGLCIGWIHGFPRWSYPYVGQVLLSSLYMTNVSTPGFLFGRELWRWRAWIPLLVASVVALVLTRSLRPLQKLFTNIKEDWTLLTFALFGGMPLFISVSFDEMDWLYSLYFMLILTLLMAGTVIVYMKNSTRKGRIKALLIGILLTIAAAVSGPAWYWFHQMNEKPWPTLIAFIIVALIMFSPALIGSIHKRVQTA